MAIESGFAPAPPQKRGGVPASRMPVAALLAGCVAWCGLAGWAEAESIRLKNGNTLRGQVLSETETELEVDLPGVGSLAIPLADVESIDEDEPSPEAFTHVLNLTNGNVLYGRLDEQTAERISVTIPGTGALTFPMAEVASVEPITPEKAKELEDELKKEMELREAAKREDPARFTRAMSRTSRGEYPSSARSVEDEEERFEREMLQQRQQMMAQVDQARQLAQKFQSGQGGILPLAPSLMAGGPRAGGSPAQQALAQNPAAAAVAQKITEILVSLGIWLYFFGVAVMLFHAVCLQRIAQRTDTDDDWMAWVPLVHIYLAIRVSNKSGWWILLYFLPVIQTIADVLVWMGIAEARGKSRWLGLLTLLPIVNLFLVGALAFGRDPERPASPGLAT